MRVAMILICSCSIPISAIAGEATSLNPEHLISLSILSMATVDASLYLPCRACYSKILEIGLLINGKNSI